MTAVFKPLEPSDVEAIRNILDDKCLEGQCYEFAIALHRSTGWPIVGLIVGGIIRHAAVRRPEGNLHDVRGPVSEKEFGEPFGVLPPYELREIGEDDLRGVRPVYEGTIELASRIIGAIVPDVPLLSRTFRSRAFAFAEELETLSRKHGLWIRGTVPTSSPVLYEGDEDEFGYMIRPTHDGLAFTVSRYFKSDL